MNKIMQSFINLLAKLLRGLFEAKQPYIRNVRNKKLIKYWWSKIFYSPEHLKRMANGYPIYPREGYGLIYYYFINNRLRYIGQTREKSLQRRMTKRQSNSHIGYNYSIKRQMLNAYRSGGLKIQTKEIRVADLDRVEEEEIRLHSKNEKLWNIEHNEYFKKTNRWF